MTLSANQPRPGHLSSKSTNPKRQPPKKDSGMKANIGGEGKAQTSSHHKSMPSSNKTNRVRPDVRVQNERGYAKTTKASGQTLHNMSAGRIRKIGRK